MTGRAKDVGQLPVADEALLDVLFNINLMGVAVLDRDLVLQRRNRVWAQFAAQHGRFTAEQVLPGRSMFDYCPGAEAAIRQMVGPVLDGHPRHYRAVPHTRSDGATSYCDLLFSPLRRDGEVIGVLKVAVDVTEQRHATDELRRSERRIRSIMRNSSDVIAVVDVAGVVSYLGPSVERLLGVPADVTARRNLLAHVHRDDLANVRAQLSRSVRSPSENLWFSCRLGHVDGSWRTYSVRAVNLLADPDVAGIVLNARDITQRAEAEAELRRRDNILEAVRFAAQRFLESQVSWRTIIDEVLGVLGRAAQVSRVSLFENYQDEDGSPASSQTHEWTAPGIPSQLDHPTLKSLSYRRLGWDDTLAAISRGEVIAGNIADRPAGVRTALEPLGILSHAVSPIFVDGRWWGVLGLQDCVRARSWPHTEIDALRAAASTLGAVIQRQHAEDLLRAQEQQYRHVFEATGDGLLVTDLDGKQVQANPAFHDMHGYQPGELTGRPATGWVHPGHHGGQVEFQRAIFTGARPSCERLDVRKDGSTFPVRVTGSLFAFHGQPHVLSVVHDDTERAQAMELLAQRVTALSGIATSMTVTKALPDTLQIIAEAIVAATPALASSVYVLDDNGSTLRMFAGVGLPDGWADSVAQCWRAGRSFPALDAVRAGTAVVIPDAVRYALSNPNMKPLHELHHGVEWDTVVIVPSQSLGGHRGTVNAYYPPEVQPSADDMAFLRAVCDQAAVAVENARLLADAHAKACLEERQRLARELHDSVSQALYGIALGTRTAQGLAEHHPDQLAEPLDYVLSLAEAGMTEMRSLIFALRPESLATEGLVAALDKQIAVLRDRHHLTVDADLGAEPDVPLALKETVYRIAQEALHNTVKHAHARHVRLRLTTSPQALELHISDDGTGFDPTQPTPGHLGLHSMRERVATHGGHLHLDTGAGTTIRAHLPVPNIHFGENA